MSTTGERVKAKAESLLGAGCAVTDPAGLARYDIDGTPPSAALQAASADEVCEVVRFALAEKLAIVPCGGATKLSMGMPPVRYDLALDLRKLDRVLQYDPGDLTVSAGAGLPLEALRQTLAVHHQLVPLDTPYFERSTLGGAIASGLDSPSRELFGTARDFLIGAEFVTGTGETGKSGGCVVKNVTGYDLHKLLAGSLGTLAVLTRVNFRTFPLPAESRTFFAAFARLNDAGGFLQAIRDSPLLPSSLELLNARAWNTALGAAIQAGMDTSDVSSCTGAREEWLVVAGFGGNAAVCSRQERDLMAMAGRASATNAQSWTGDSDALARQVIREALPAIWESGGGTGMIVRIGTSPASATALIGSLCCAPELQPFRPMVLARGGGTVYFALSPSAGGGSSDAFPGAVRTALAIIAKHAAPAMIPWCAPQWKSELPVWGEAGRDILLMRRIKQAFDPQGIFAPGRFAGGI